MKSAKKLGAAQKLRRYIQHQTYMQTRCTNDKIDYTLYTRKRARSCRKVALYSEIIGLKSLSKCETSHYFAMLLPIRVHDVRQLYSLSQSVLKRPQKLYRKKYSKTFKVIIHRFSSFQIQINYSEKLASFQCDHTHTHTYTII